MASEGRQTRSVVSYYQKLSSAPYEFDFYRAVRLLEKYSAQKPRIGDGVKLSDEFLKLTQIPSLSFAASTLKKFSYPDSIVSRPKLEINFQGLLGPNGPLPLHLTEYVYQRELHHGDATMKDFLDIFHHRLLSLFYRAWANAEPVCQADRDDDMYRDYIGAICGLSLDSTKNRDCLNDNVKLSNAASFASHNKTPESLANICSNYLETEVTIEEFVGHWMPLTEDDFTRLEEGNTGCILGGSAVLGENIWDRNSKMAVCIGPIDYQSYLKLLPINSTFSELAAIVKNFISFELIWEARITLKRSELPEPSLDGSSGLGWNCWLGDPGEEDRSDLALHI